MGLVLRRSALAGAVRLEVMESASITRPPRMMRSQMPARYRYLTPLADPVLGKTMAITLFRASSPAAAG